LTLRKQLAARREHRENIEPAINKVWERLAPEMRRVGVDDQKISQILADQLNALTEDDKKYLGEVFLPDFREMLRLFREKMWLAEPSKLAHFGTIVEYVDTWELSLRGAITGGVAIELQRRSDAKLRQFYADLETTYDRLRRELTEVQSGKLWSAFVASIRQRWLLTLTARPAPAVSQSLRGTAEDRDPGR
jgi:hypothetical protein